MREVINNLTATSGGVTLTSAANGQLIIGVVGLIFMILFGVCGVWLKWRDSQAIRRALEAGDLSTALRIRGK